MMRHLGEEPAAAAIEKAVADALLNPEHHTPDLGGKATTRELTRAIVARVLKI